MMSLQSTNVEKNGYTLDTTTCRAEKVPRTECSDRRFDMLSHQISMGSIDDDVTSPQCAYGQSRSESSIENGIRLVSESSQDTDGSAEEDFSDEEFSDDDYSDDESADGAASLGDCGVTSIVVDYVSEGTSGEEAGRFITGNTQLKKLAIKGGSMEWNADSTATRWFEGLCAGVAGSRSITNLCFRDCSLTNESATRIISTISPFVELNPNLQRLVIAGCNLGDESTKLLASALEQRENKTTLQRVLLDANNIGDEAGQCLLQALDGYDNLMELSLGDNEIGTKSCGALSNLLSRENANLREVNIENNQIDDIGIAFLTNALEKNTVLRELNLSFNCNITQTGWQIFANCLQNPNSALEMLDISSTDVEDEGAVALGHALANNKTLRTLNCFDISVDGSPLISATGWQSIFACLQNNASVLERIDLRYGSIDERGLSALTDALAGNCTLKELDLSHNKQIAATGWRSLLPCLEHPCTALEEIRLSGNNITDKEAADLARSIRSNNGKLVTLDLGANSFVTDAGWAHFSKVLCDASSVEAIHSSNHTLRSLGEPNLPQHLDELLMLNSRCDASVARAKILQHHFKNGKANVQNFADMNLNVLPRAMAWAGNNNSGSTVLYELLRSLPASIAHANVAKVVGGKRKRTE